MDLSLYMLKVQQIDKKIARNFVVNNHYLKRSPNITQCFGLFKKDDLIGVITFSRPHSSSLVKKFNPYKVHELSRLCIIADKRKNLASFFVSKALKLLGSDLVVSFADPNHGHLGFVYQASNWTYLGQNRDKTEYKVKGLEHKHELSILYGFRMPELKEFYGDRLYKTKKKGLHRYLYIRKTHPLYPSLTVLPYPKIL